MKQKEYYDIRAVAAYGKKRFLTVMGLVALSKIKLRKHSNGFDTEGCGFLTVDNYPFDDLGFGEGFCEITHEELEVLESTGKFFLDLGVPNNLACAMLLCTEEELAQYVANSEILPYYEVDIEGNRVKIEGFVSRKSIRDFCYRNIKNLLRELKER